MQLLLMTGTELSPDEAALCERYDIPVLRKPFLGQDAISLIQSRLVHSQAGRGTRRADCSPRSGVTVARQTLGKTGEDLAAAELERRGYAVLARRYRTRHGEIDIVAQDGDTTGVRRGEGAGDGRVRDRDGSRDAPQAAPAGVDGQPTTWRGST